MNLTESQESYLYFPRICLHSFLILRARLLIRVVTFRDFFDFKLLRLQIKKKEIKHHPDKVKSLFTQFSYVYLVVLILIKFKKTKFGWLFFDNDTNVLTSCLCSLQVYIQKFEHAHASFLEECWTEKAQTKGEVEF